jgi:hypothetical protein
LSLTAIPDPLDANWPAGMPTWDGVIGAGQGVTAGVDTTINAGQTKTVTASCGESLYVYLQGVGVADIQQDGDSVANHVINVPINSEALAFTAIPNPAGNWPDGFPVWDGNVDAAGDTATFNPDTAGTFTVKASCDRGYSSQSVTVNVISVNMTVPSRIPPRVSTMIPITIQPDNVTVTFEVQNTGGGNGNAIFADGNNTYSGDGDLSLTTPEASSSASDPSQTTPGNAGNLVVVATIGSTELARSTGFTVAAWPQNWTITFNRLLNDNRRGFIVNDACESDSGVAADLDQVEISEQVQTTSATGVFVGARNSNSGYLPALPFSTDTHGTPVRFINAPGGQKIANQTSEFRCNRSGVVDRPVPNSGYTISRIVDQDSTGAWQLTTSKVGAAVTANGVASGAGQPTTAISRTQKP